MTRSLYIKVTASDDVDSAALDASVQAAIRSLTAADYQTSASLITDLVDEGQRLVRADYDDDVRSLADEFIANWNQTGSDPFSDREQAMEWLNESIDGTQRVIYTYQAQLGLACSSNSGAYIDEYGAEGAVESGDIAWSKLMYAALYQDVIDYIGDDININGEPPKPDDECDTCSHERRLHSAADDVAGCTGTVGTCATCQHEALRHDSDNGCLARVNGGFCDCETYVPSGDAGVCDCGEFDQAS